MRLKGWLRRSAVAGGSLAALVVAGWAAFEAADRAFPPPLPEKLAVSTEVVDRDGQLLRAYATPDGRWRLASTLDQVDPQFVKMLVLRGQAFLRACRRRLHRACPRGDAVREQWPHRFGRLHAVDAARAPDRAARKPQLRQQAPPDLPGDPDRAAAFQGRCPGALSDAGALWRNLGVRAASLAWFGKEPKPRRFRGSPAGAAAMPERRRPIVS